MLPYPFSKEVLIGSEILYRKRSERRVEGRIWKSSPKNQIEPESAGGPGNKPYSSTAIRYMTS